jgi:hypothetical protein
MNIKVIGHRKIFCYIEYLFINKIIIIIVLLLFKEFKTLIGYKNIKYNN